MRVRLPLIFAHTEMDVSSPAAHHHNHHQTQPQAAAATTTTLEIPSQEVYARLEANGFNLFEAISGAAMPEIKEPLSLSPLFQNARATFCGRVASAVAVMCDAMLHGNGAPHFTVHYLRGCLHEHDNLSRGIPRQLGKVLSRFYTCARRAHSVQQVSELADLFARIVQDPHAHDASSDPTGCAEEVRRTLDLLARALTPPSADPRYLVGCLHYGGIPAGRGEEEVVRRCCAGEAWLGAADHLRALAFAFLQEQWAHTLYMQQERSISMRVAGTMAGLVDLVNGHPVA